jgi:glycosyltransferase involved in cell wall biosynthesis
MNKTFSVIIPFYKGEVFYPSLIVSVRQAMLKCDFKAVSFEIISVIDSMDTEHDVINKITLECFIGMSNVKVVTIKNNENIGVAGSRNKAISISTGNYLHIIDQDDSVLEVFYQEITPLLTDYNFVLSNGLVHYTNKNYNSHKLYYINPRLSTVGLLKNDFVRSPGQVVFLKELLKNKFFPEPKNYKGADDRFFWLRIFMENENNIKPIYITNSNYIANIHDDNYSGDTINLKKSTLENWSIFKNGVDTLKFGKLIDNDILRIRFALNENMSFLDNFKGRWLNMVYFLELNKILRFIKKRKI